MKQFRSIIPKTKNWLFVFYLVFAAYLFYDGFVYLLNPFSGRISTLICEQDIHEQAICTVTIYGIRDTYQREFKAEDFQKAVIIKDWNGSSSNLTCGITIVTADEKINYIHPTQNSQIISKKVDTINQLLNSGQYTPDTRMFHIGFNSSFYRRGILLVIGLVIVLRTKKSGKMLLVPGFSLRSEGSFSRFSKYWAVNNFLVRLFFYLSIAFVLAIWTFTYPGKQGDLIRSCGQIFRHCDQCSEFPLSYLLCLYPLLTVLVLQALVQRQMLINFKVPVSAWWVAAPVIASFSLMFLSPKLTCADCTMLKYLMSGISAEFDAEIGIYLVVYFLFIGFFQWLVLRRHSPFSKGWVIMPLVNAMLVVTSYVIAYYNYFNTGYLFYFVMPSTLIASEIFPAMYMSWLLHKKNPE